MISLRTLLAANGGLATRFLADETRTVSLAALLATHGDEDWARHLYGKSVFAAVAGQLAAAAALVSLDGVASRIVLWPHDEIRPQIATAMQAAAADVALTKWPLPDCRGLDATNAGGPRTTGSAPMTAALNTEWVLLTSGTTGRPKLVFHTLETLSGHLWGGDAGPAGAVWCTFYDIRRYGGLQILFRALLNGGSLVLSSTDEAPGRLLQRAALAKATHFLGTPSHWRRALMTDAAREISPHYIRLSGEAPDQAILDRLRAAYPDARIVHAFASTEAGLGFEVADGLAGFPQSMAGRPGSTAEISVQGGTLRLRSPRNAKGYLDGTAQSLVDSDGFVDTGDILALRDGRYYFAGRRDGTINVGGLKVHPEEVESVINQHPAVQMSMVLGRANPITGAIVVAKIVPRPAGAQPASGAGGLQEEIRAFCSARLEAYKVPVAVSFVDDLNLSPAGKLVRLRA